MKNKYAQKRQLQRQRNRLVLIIGIPLLITIILGMTVTLLMINKSKYSEVSATVFINEQAEDASQRVTLRYVISGEAYFQNMEKVPSKWDNDQLVRIEYLLDDFSVIRKVVNVSPFVFLLVISIIADIIIGLKVFSEFREVFLKKEVSQEQENR